jgi:hypothetical protein
MGCLLGSLQRRRGLLESAASSDEKASKQASERTSERVGRQAIKTPQQIKSDIFSRSEKREEACNAAKKKEGKRCRYLFLSARTFALFIFLLCKQVTCGEIVWR